MTITADAGTPGGSGGEAPLVEIEHAVQTRAKDLGLDLAIARGAAELRLLIEDEIRVWNDDFKRGIHSTELVDTARLCDRAFRNLAGYGPLTPLLDDDDVWEIMINAPDAIFVKRHGAPSGYHDEAFHDDDHVARTITKLLDDSSTSHRKLDAAQGLQDAQLDSGARLHIVHPDVARGGHLMVNIRKFTGVAYTRLDQLVEMEMLDDRSSRFLSAAVRSAASIVFSGSPGSGKTTMLSCCAAEIDATKRVVIAEEVFEADVPVANVASMQTRSARVDREPVDLRRLVSGFLRMAPDVAIVGEVRDKEALPLLLTLSSGVAGFTTIHAGSGRQALSRLRFVCQLSETSNELSASALNSLISEAVDIVVHCARTPLGPRVTEIIAVEELATSGEGNQFTATEVFLRGRYDAPLEWTGQIPERMARAFEHHGHDVREILVDHLGATS